MRAHSRPEPLVRLEVSLNLCVVQQGGAITWRKPSSKNTDQQEREEDQLPRADHENSHPVSASHTVETSGQWAEKCHRTPVTPFFIQ